MRRKIYDDLVKFKETNGKTALLIEGARRVGKSYIVEQFAKENYKSYILIDFLSAPIEVKKLFDDYLYNLDDFFMYLQSFYGITLYERNSLIIFDEVQLFPKARAAIKYLVKDGRYDFIETGSLVSIKENVEDILIPSEERHIEMYPMDFEEFLWAMDNESLCEVIKKSYNSKKPMGQLMHRKAMDYFRKYTIIGGMPQAVLEYINSNDFKEVDLIKRDILTLYREDIVKHAKKYALKVESIWDAIPSQLQKHEKKFRLSSLEKGLKRRNYEDAFMWLKDAMTVNICFNATEPTIGLKLSSNNSLLKLYMADTGLLISHAFDENGIVSNEVYKKILFDKLEFNGGMIAENIVAQMLLASNHKLFFYSTYSKDKENRMEIDFLITKKDITSRHNICPLEVKTSKRYTLNSLNKFNKKYKKQLGTSYVIHYNDLKTEDNIVYLPIYMTMLL